MKTRHQTLQKGIRYDHPDSLSWKEEFLRDNEKEQYTKLLT